MDVCIVTYDRSGLHITQSAVLSGAFCFAEGFYIIFDCPGQVELFTMHSSLKNVVKTITDRWHYRCAAALYAAALTRSGRHNLLPLPPSLPCTALTASQGDLSCVLEVPQQFSPFLLQAIYSLS